MRGVIALVDQDRSPGPPGTRQWRSTRSLPGSRPPHPTAAPSVIADNDARRHRLESLLRVVEAEVVPRLRSAFPAATPANPTDHAGLRTMPVPAIATLPPDLVIAFADTLLRGEAEPAAGMIAALFAEGVSAETICIELMAGAARHLGELWAQDICTFTDVTIATSVMQMLLRDVTARLSTTALVSPATGSALLVQTPGEQHSFGVAMLADFFRTAGWAVQTPRINTAKDVARLASERMVHLIGFSLGAETHLSTLRRCIGLARRSSRNPDLIVMVGGPVFVDQPDLVAMVEADGTAATATEAVQRAGALLHARRRAASPTGGSV